MENAAYVALSRQMTLRRELDIVANNIANADTTGFKVEQLLLGEEVGERARNAFVRPGVSFVLDNGVGRDFGQGALAQTGRVLDFAIEGEGAFFTVTDGAGDAYTRDGAFTLDPEGRLTTEGGATVQGDGGDIILDPALGQVTVAPSARMTSWSGGSASSASTPWRCSKRAATACTATPPTPPPSRPMTSRCVRPCWRARTSIRSSKSPI